MRRVSKSVVRSSSRYVASTLRTPAGIVRRNVERELTSEREQLLVRNHVVDQAPHERGRRVDEVAGDAHLACPAVTDRLGEQHGQPPARHDPDPRVRVGEAGAFGRDQEVACERDLETARDRGAVDRADDRLGGLGERPDQLVVAGHHVTDLGVVGEALQVDAGAERGVGAGEHDGVDVVARVAGRDRRGERRGEGRIQRVARLRTVQR